MKWRVPSSFATTITQAFIEDGLGHAFIAAEPQHDRRVVAIALHGVAAFCRNSCGSCGSTWKSWVDAQKSLSTIIPYSSHRS